VRVFPAFSLLFLHRGGEKERKKEGGEGGKVLPSCSSSKATSTEKPFYLCFFRKGKEGKKGGGKRGGGSRNFGVGLL